MTKLKVIYIFNLLDLLFTFLLFLKFGASAELNPIGVFLLENPVILFGYKIGIVGVCLIILYRFRQTRIAKIAAWGVFGAYGVLMIWHLINFVVIEIYI